MPDRDAQLYAAARRVLLDAVEAAQPFQQHLIVVGAQAVYLRTQAATVQLSPFTTDGDLIVDPRNLPTHPALEALLATAGFDRSVQPGSWVKAVVVGDFEQVIPVDFMVPDSVAPGTGSRSVDLVGHDRLATRRVRGLEAALVDHGQVEIRSLEDRDHRSMTVQVAGPAALLIAKVHKIYERVDDGRHQKRSVDKDAADVYRLFQAISIPKMVEGFQAALANEVSRSVSEEGLTKLSELFSRRAAVGVTMAQRAIGVSGESEDAIASTIIGYCSRLIDQISK